MHIKMVYLILILTIVCGKVHGEPPATKPADSADAKRCFTKIAMPWMAGQYAECREAFAKDSTSQGRTSLEEASKQAEQIIDRRAIERLHGSEKYEVHEHQVTAVLSSSWVLQPLKGVRESKQLLVTEERFTFIDVDGKVMIDTYAITDVTFSTKAVALTRIEKRKAILNDQSKPIKERLTRGLEMIEELWELNQVDDLWPLLKQLVDLGIAKDKQGKQLLGQLVVRVLRTDKPPKQYEAIVNSLIK